MGDVNKYKPDWHRYLERCEFSVNSSNAKHHFKITVPETTNVMFGMFADGQRKRSSVVISGELRKSDGEWLGVVTRGQFMSFYDDDKNDSQLELAPGVYYF